MHRSALVLIASSLLPACSTETFTRAASSGGSGGASGAASLGPSVGGAGVLSIAGAPNPSSSIGGALNVGTTPPVESGGSSTYGGAPIGGTAAGGTPTTQGQAGATLGTSCTTGETRCGGAAVETVVLRCNQQQSEFVEAGYCSETGTQCNPTTGKCFLLDVDKTEVTRAAYAVFLSKGSALQDELCTSINTSLVPDANCMTQPTVCQGAGCGNHPQVCVDWCDATAYCKAQGRRLCGRISGGMNPFDRFADAGSSQWMNACSAGGQYKYSSGDRVDSGPRYCNYVGTQLGTTHEVGTRLGCTSPSPSYAGIYDLSGNVAEWEDSCERSSQDLAASASDACRTRGGSYASALTALECDTVPASALRRTAASPEVGFRCCGE